MRSLIHPLTLVAFGTLVEGHGAIIAATGDMGGNGMAIGIDTSTPRDGTDDVPFQQDTTVFEGDAEFSCGETDQTSENDQVNDIESGVEGVMANSNSSQLPQVSQGGELQMTLHEVNSDGGGPYVCMIDATGTGQNWVAMEVTEQVPGDDGDNDEGEATDFPLTAKVAQGQMCTGSVAGQENVCMVRCQNPQGPFGGCVPVQLAGEINEPENPIMSETGGSAEDDVDAIVEAAENAEDGEGGAAGADEDADDEEAEDDEDDEGVAAGAADGGQNGANADEEIAEDDEKAAGDEEEEVAGGNAGATGEDEETENGDVADGGDGPANGSGDATEGTEDATDGGEESESLGLSDRAKQVKTRKMKRAMRAALRRHQRKARRAARKAARRAAKMR